MRIPSLTIMHFSTQALNHQRLLRMHVRQAYYVETWLSLSLAILLKVISH